MILLKVFLLCSFLMVPNIVLADVAMPGSERVVGNGVLGYVILGAILCIIAIVIIVLVNKKKKNK